MPNELTSAAEEGLGFARISIQALLKHAREMQGQETLRGHSRTDLVSGIVSREGALKKYRLRDELGNTEEFERAVVDIQSGAPIDLERPSELPPGAEKSKLAAANCAFTVFERISALQDWLAWENDPVADFILEQLERRDIGDDWRRALVLACEAVRFQGDFKLRALDLLLSTGQMLRFSNDPQATEAVWSAVQRAGSLIPLQRANDLTVFLVPDGFVDTRLAALQTIVHIFEIEPPRAPGDFKPLADRVVALATKHWDADVFVPGEASAIAIEGTVAAASLVDHRTVDLVRLAISTRRDWVVRRVRQRFEGLHELWTGHEPGRQAANFITEVLDELRSTGQAAGLR